MTWLRWDAEYDQHPDVMAAGWQAAIVFERVCRIVKKFDLRGSLPAKYLTPEYLHRVTAVPVTVLRVGITNCLKIGLIKEGAEQGANDYLIPGWSGFQLDPTNAERQARHRERQAEEKPITGVTVSNGSNDDGTGRYVTRQTNKDLIMRFEKFWEAYPRKRSKAKALERWLKIKPDEQLQNTILESLERAKTLDFNHRLKSKIPYPATWLNAKAWLDEIDASEDSSDRSDTERERVRQRFLELTKDKA